MAIDTFLRAARDIATDGTFDGFGGVVTNGQLNARFAARTPHPPAADSAVTELPTSGRTRYRTKPVT